MSPLERRREANKLFSSLTYGLELVKEDPSEKNLEKLASIASRLRALISDIDDLPPLYRRKCSAALAVCRHHV